MEEKEIYTTAHRKAIAQAIGRYLTEQGYKATVGHFYQVEVATEEDMVRAEIALSYSGNEWHRRTSGLRVVFRPGYKSPWNYTFRKWVKCTYEEESDLWLVDMAKVKAKLDELASSYDEFLSRRKKQQQAHGTEIAKIQAAFPGYDVLENWSDYRLIWGEITFDISVLSEINTKRYGRDDLLFRIIGIRVGNWKDMSVVAGDRGSDFMEAIVQVVDKFKLQEVTNGDTGGES